VILSNGYPRGWLRGWRLLVHHAHAAPSPHLDMSRLRPDNLFDHFIISFVVDRFCPRRRHEAFSKGRYAEGGVKGVEVRVW
jgi:hypothetical protein